MDTTDLSSLDLKKEYQDDDKLFSDAVSLRRRLTIIEKFLMILIAIVIIPITSVVGRYVQLGDYALSFKDPNAFDPLGKDFIYTIAPYLVSIFFVLFCEFASKNVSVRKGIFRTFFISLFFSLTINVTSFSLIISFQFAITKRNLDAELMANFLLLAVFAAVFYSVLLLLARVIFVIINHYKFKYVMIIGPKDDADTLLKRIIKENKKHFAVRYVFYEFNGELSDRFQEKLKKVNTIILLDSLSVKTKEKVLLYFSSTLNKDVYLCSTYFDIVSYSNAITDISGMVAIDEKPLRIDMVEAFVKRVFDILLSLVFLILTLPIWLFVPIAIKLDSKGPVFFKQERYTQNMRPFKILKFRSMVVNADANTLAQVGDKRVTRVGKIIRATRIDEIPQVLNVLKGDMSFVGPRAWMTSVVEDGLKTLPEFKYRFNVKAGITGLQQVRTKAGTDSVRKLKYDLYYIQNYNLVLDIYIIFLTIKTVFEKEMAEGIDENERPLTDYLLDEGVLTNLHWDYRSLFYPNSVNKANREFIKETVERTIEMRRVSDNKPYIWMPKGTEDDEEKDEDQNKEDEKKE